MPLANVFREFELYQSRRPPRFSSLHSACSHSTHIKHRLVLWNLKQASLIKESEIPQRGWQMVQSAPHFLLLSDCATATELHEWRSWFLTKSPRDLGTRWGNKSLTQAGALCNRNTGFRKWSKISSSLAANETQSRMHTHRGQEYDSNVASALKYKT